MKKMTIGFMMVLLLTVMAAAQSTAMISVSQDNVQANRESWGPKTSADGRWVVFVSFASNLVSGDTNGCSDVFVRDCLTGSTERVSVSSTGQQGYGSFNDPDISADGRFVVFDSSGSALVAGDTNGCVDVFVRDRQAQSTFRVSVSSANIQGNNVSYLPVISGDGRFVAFSSLASNLVGYDGNDRMDVFVHDTLYRTTELVSVSSTGVIGNGDSWMPAISADGSVIAFSSLATNLVRSDTNGLRDIFVRLRDSRSTTRVSISKDGAQANGESEEPAVSGNGRKIAYASQASNLVNQDTNGVCDVFVHDISIRSTIRASLSSQGYQGNCISYEPSLSFDGNLVAFTTRASNLVPNDTNSAWDILVRDQAQGVTFRVSTATGGGQSNGNSWQPAIVSFYPAVVFGSTASNLVPNDTNGYYDIFIVTW